MFVSGNQEHSTIISHSGIKVEYFLLFKIIIVMTIIHLENWFQREAVVV